MKCHFCKQEKPLCKAHIIPEAFYREIRPNDGRALLKIVDNIPNPIKSHTGIYDPEILCAECDAKIGKWDEQAINFFRVKDTWEKISLKRDKTIDYYQVANTGYSSIKLFAKSLLWRASISKRLEYKTLKLGRYQELFLKDLKAGFPGDKEDCSVILTVLRKTENPHYSNSKELMHKSMMNIHLEKINHVNFYRVKLNEFVILIKVDQRLTPSPFNRLMISQDEPFRILEREFDGSYEERYLRSVVLPKEL